ncbi:unnamed protein product, partial [Rotaria magnacalcarata]
MAFNDTVFMLLLVWPGELHLLHIKIFGEERFYIRLVIASRCEYVVN